MVNSNRESVMDSSTIIYKGSTGVYAAHGFGTQLGGVTVLLIIQIQFIVVSLLQLMRC